MIKVVLFPSQNNPRIMRDNDNFGIIRGMDCVEEIRSLVGLIQKNEVTHMYLSSRESYKGYGSKILTFSSQAPSTDLYDLGKVLPVRVNEGRELEINALIVKLRERL